LVKEIRDSKTIEFDDNHALQTLFGPHNINLDRMEDKLGVSIVTLGNRISVDGAVEKVRAATEILNSLYKKALGGENIEIADVDAFCRMKQDDEPAAFISAEKDLSLHTRKRNIIPRTKGQAEYIAAMDKFEMVFGLGPAGTGKTYLAVAKAVVMMMEGKIDRIILTRPAVEAGENLGFLPGDLKEKIDPYLRPLYDALYEMLPAETVDKKIEMGEIEIAPLAFMRGRTLNNAFVILDEAQNTTPMQMKMFLTRLGENSRMVINGDLTQTDLPRGVQSGLFDALEVVTKINNIGIVKFSERDVVRHGLVSKIVKAYDSRQAERKGLANAE
jgi:phosphate starvation-inducible PhoH-like protein